MLERSTTTTRLTRRSTKVGWLVALLLFGTALTVQPAHSQDRYRTVSVADPYLEMHTGPGRGFPKFHVVDRGETVEVMKRRTDWFLVRTERGKEGWVDRDQMERTLQPQGDLLDFSSADQDDFTNSRWEAGVMAGDFGGASIISAYGAYSLNPHVGVEFWGSQILGNFSNGWMGSVNVIHETWPDFRISPFFTMGAGVVHTAPKSTIVQGEDRTDQVGHAGAGLRFYLTRRFVLRAEFKSYVVFTSRDDNEEVEEWKAGFAFFF